MKKLLVIYLIFLIPIGVAAYDGKWGISTTGGTAGVEDDAYGAGWNGDTLNAPSQNAVYDKIETMSGVGDMTKAVYDTGDDGSADTANALAANGGNCSAGSYPLGVDASGAVESCTDATTEINSAIATHAALYLPLTGGTLSGQLQAPIKGATSTGGAMTINAVTIGTAAADYDLPDSCDSATFNWAMLYMRDAEAGSLTVSASEDTIVYKGLSLNADDELDSASAAQDSVVVVCMEANKWYVTANSGDWTDGGAAD